MPALDPSLRTKLENDVVRARTASEHAAKNALERLAVGEPTYRPSMTDGQRALRRALRARARQLGDATPDNAQADLNNLVRECAYEQWHQMLFAKFLLENGLLMHPEGVAVSFAECAELAREEGDADAWATAARYASHMLPGIFRPEDPLLQVGFALEDRRALETILDGIPKPTFTSDDGLGWVYQFWQTQAKKDVNASGRKIGGRDLPAVTQLFTEHYMVQFLLHNTLGAWWADRHPDIPLPTDKSYLRTLGGSSGDDGNAGTPAAGRFEGWPDAAKDLKLIDPCCGSGHFLVAAFALLTRMRMLEENLSERDAGDAVLRDNLHGLELDPRCTQLAAFNLALEAWKRGGYRTLPSLNVACSGVSVGGREEEWTKLAGDDTRAASSLKRLYTMFKNAPDLGSLIDPTRLGEDDHLYTARFDEVEVLLDQALARAKGEDDPAAAVFGEAARGVTNAARLLRGKYHLVITNVPYLGQVKMEDAFREHVARNFSAGKADLATAFLERCFAFAKRGCVVATVSPQSWWFQSYYKAFRAKFLNQFSWNIAVPIGEEAWTTFGIRGPRTVLTIITNKNPDDSSKLTAINTSQASSQMEIVKALLDEALILIYQKEMFSNQDHLISLSEVAQQTSALSQYATALKGASAGDLTRFTRCFWELHNIRPDYEFYQSAPSSMKPYGARDMVIYWQNESGDMYKFAQSVKHLNHAAQNWLRGKPSWNKPGVVVGLVRSLYSTLYTGDIYDSSCCAIVPNNLEHLLPLWVYCESGAYGQEVRKLNPAVIVGSNNTLLQVPFDLEHWQQVAAETYPDGLPEPYSDDPTQWLFSGAIGHTPEPLQVAVARLLGYAWPEQGQSTGAHPFPERETDLSEFIDDDGVVCLHPSGGERGAAERLRLLLEHVYGESWTSARQEALLGPLGYGGKDLHEWLRKGFFAQHCKLFNNRPFIWQIWDKRDDGFSVLVNYHKLTKARLERLIYTYLGDYLTNQSRAAQAGEKGADLRLAAAQELKGKLEAILHGEAPHDIYVRWKAKHEQPIGWDPDLNDGVRLNVRPFVAAGVLRSKFTVHWKKDRGTNPDGTERHNDVHLTRAEKEAARAAAG